MVETRRERLTGATAHLDRGGRPVVTNPDGTTIDIATAGSGPGLTPLDLLYSSLAACLVISARIAASELKLLPRFDAVTARVTGDKANGRPTRIGAIRSELSIAGALEDAERDAIVRRAEEICTVSNTLRGGANVSVTTRET